MTNQDIYDQFEYEDCSECRTPTTNTIWSVSAVTESRSAQAFVDTILAKGGVWGAIEYGLNPHEYNLPPAIFDAWVQITKIGRLFDQATDSFVRMTKNAGLEWE